METIKIKTETKVVGEKEIPLPYYCKSSGAFICVVSKNKGIKVSAIEVGYCSPEIWVDENSTECTAEEFFAAYHSTLKAIEELLPVVVKPEISI